MPTCTHMLAKGKRHAGRRARPCVAYVLAQLKTQHNGKYGSCPPLTPPPPPPLLFAILPVCCCCRKRKRVHITRIFIAITKSAAQRALLLCMYVVLSPSTALSHSLSAFPYLPHCLSLTLSLPFSTRSMTFTATCNLWRLPIVQVYGFHFFHVN